MANNMVVGPQAVVSKSNVSFETAGITPENCAIIYKAKTGASYVPGRSINGITSFEMNEGYYIVMLAVADLSAYLHPPVTIPSSILNNLVAYWKLDEASGNRLDSTSNHYDLVPIAAPGSGAGKVGTSAVFNGSAGQLLKGPGSNALSIDTTAGFCITAWIKIPTGLTEAMMIIAKTDAAGIHREYAFYYNPIDTTHGALTFVLGNTAGTAWAGLCEHDITVDGNWLFCFAQWFTDGTLSIGQGDGSVFTSGSVPNATPHTGGTGEFTIGGNMLGDKSLTGSIDEVGVWKGLIDNPRDAATYNGGAGGTYPF